MAVMMSGRKAMTFKPHGLTNHRTINKMEPFETKVHRKPIETTIHIADAQKGFSYEEFFAPYLKGAKRVKIVHASIDCQLANFIDFFKVLAPVKETLEVTLRVTSASSRVQEHEIGGILNDVRSGLEEDQITLTYSFDESERDLQGDSGEQTGHIQKTRGKLYLQF
jgi:hypothetical protein